MSSEIIEKIRKLLALERSPNEHEAALAAIKARELLDKYNLSIADVYLSGRDTQSAKMARIDLPYKKIPVWVSALAESVAETFDCESYRYQGMQQIFLGMETDVAVAEHVFIYLFRAIKNCWRRHRGKKRYSKRYRNGYYIGAVFSVMTRLAEFAQRRREGLSPECTALAIRKESVIRDYLDQRGIVPVEATANEGPSVDRRGLNEGYMDGEDIPLQHAIEVRR